MNADQLDDAAIVCRVIEGDVNAFELLLARYSSFVHGVAARRVPEDSVKDVAQDIFLSAYRSLRSYSGGSGFKSWLGRIAARRCYDFWRERKKQRETPFSQLSDEHRQWIEKASATESAEGLRDAASEIEAKELLDYALGQLSARDRMALTLVCLEGMPAKEAAALLGWSSVLMRVCVHRARGRLRGIIAGLLEAGESDEKES